MNKTTFDTRIDEILYKLQSDTVHGETRQAQETAHSEAKAQLRTLVNDVCMEVIGKPRKAKLVYSKNNVNAQVENSKSIAALEAVDELQATQRTKLATILEGSEDNA